MKVLIYTKYFSPVPGGVQTVVMELARGLASWSNLHPGSEKIEVTVATETRERDHDDDSLPFDLIRRPRLSGLIRLIRRANLVHLAGPVILPLTIALLFRKPVVIEHHGFQTVCPNGLLFFEPSQAPCPGHFMARRYGKCIECNRRHKGFKRSLYALLATHVRRWLSNRASINITPTDWLATVLKLKKMKTVYHGIAPGVAAVSTKSPVPTFAYQGRLVSTKGIALLLLVAERLRRANYEFRLKVIGDGPGLFMLKSRAAAGSNGQTEILGHVPATRLEDAFSDVDAVVIPSLAGEVFGLVAAENMLREKAVIVSDLGALREVVGPAGLVFRTGDADDLASCMRRIMEVPSLAASLGQAARARATQIFGVESMIAGHVSVYQEATRR